MWNEVVIFVARAGGSDALREWLDSIGATTVYDGGRHLILGDMPLEVLDESDLWNSYSESERRYVDEVLPDAWPLLVLYMDRAVLLRFLHLLPKAIELFVDPEEEGPLRLLPRDEFISLLKA